MADTYLWIKYSPYSNGLDMTDYINDFTVDKHFEITFSADKTNWSHIVYRFDNLTGTFNFKNISATITGDSTNKLDVANFSKDGKDIENQWGTIGNEQSELVGKEFTLKFDYSVDNHTKPFQFAIFLNDDWNNIPFNQVPMNTKYIGMADGKDSSIESNDPSFYTWTLLDDSNNIESGGSNETTEDSSEFNGTEYQDSDFVAIAEGGGNSGIEAGSEDKWGNENYSLPCALYFYYMGDDINSGNEYENWNTEYTNAVLGNCSAIQSVQYVPFLRKDDLQLLGVPYDVARFGQLQASHPKLDWSPTVYRIKALTTQVKTLGTFNCYTPSLTIGGQRNWKNESRLYNYPYQFAMITDHLNPPFEVKYHLVPNGTGTIKVLQTISDRCSYGLFVEGYKGDNGKLEAMVSGEAHELPCSSSAYNQWYASNKNQVSQNVRNMSETAFLQNGNIQNNQMYNMVNTGLGVASNLLSGNVGSMIFGTASTISSGLQNNMNMNFQQRMNNVAVSQQRAMNSAIQKDLRNTPNTMISMGSDVYYGLAKGGYQLDLYRFGLTNEYYNKLGDYFAMYGYKQNKVMTINIRNRYYYNYIKTIGVNLEGTNIPRSHLEQLKEIFDNGVTVWHIDRNGVTVDDYSMDNYEV